MTLQEERSSEIDKEYDDMLEDRRRFAEEVEELNAEKVALWRINHCQQMATESLIKGERQGAILINLASVVTVVLVGGFAILIDRTYFGGGAMTPFIALGRRLAERFAHGESLEHDI